MIRIDLGKITLVLFLCTSSGYITSMGVASETVTVDKKVERALLAFAAQLDEDAEKIAREVVEMSDSRGYLILGLLFKDRLFERRDEDISFDFLSESSDQGNRDATIELLVTVTDAELPNSGVLSLVNKKIHKIIVEGFEDVELSVYIYLYCLYESERVCEQYDDKILSNVTGAKISESEDSKLVGLVSIAQYVSSRGSDKKARERLIWAANQGDIVAQKFLGDVLVQEGQMRDGMFWQYLSHLQSPNSTSTAFFREFKARLPKEYGILRRDAMEWLHKASKNMNTLLGALTKPCEEALEHLNYIRCLVEAYVDDNDCTYDHLEVFKAIEYSSSKRYLACRELMLQGSEF